MINLNNDRTSIVTPFTHLFLSLLKTPPHPTITPSVPQPLPLSRAVMRLSSLADDNNSEEVSSEHVTVPKRTILMQ